MNTDNGKAGSIGILAYGSLIDDPGDEIGPLIRERRTGIDTPFRIEFARTSEKRKGAPTLIPVSEGGATVQAVILVLDEAVTLKDAEDMLWRRESGKSGAYKPTSKPNKNTVIVRTLSNFHELSCVLYTEIGDNIPQLNAQTLADLAIRSAKDDACAKGKDGISYLIDAKKNGIATPLMDEYEKIILATTGSDTLEKALTKCLPKS